MQLVGEDEVDPDDLYGIPERMHHNRTLSRVVDSPQDRAIARSNNGFPQLGDKSEQPGNSYLAGNESHLRIPQSPLDTMITNPSKGRILPETSPNTMIANLAEDCSHVSQSVQGDVIATQGLPAPDPSQYYIRLSRETARRLEERGAPDWTASDDGEHVYCQCNFNQEEGKMVRVQQTLREVFCAEKALPCRCSADTARTGSTIIVTGISRRCYQMTIPMRAIVVCLLKTT